MQKKRKKRIWLVILIIICAILYFVKINFLGEENYYTSEPYQFNSTSVKTERLCQFQNYTYEYQWEGWYPEQGNLITPQYRLYNTDTETGTYEVHFAFFDEAIYPFSQFEGVAYNTIENALPWDQAAMHSKKVNVTLGSGKDALLIMPTRKPKSNAIYWAYARVKTPSHYVCEESISTDVEKKDIKYRNVTHVRQVKESMRLYQYLIYLWHSS